MKNIKLIRVDDRLIHGQVVTSWITQTGSKKIIIIDDELYENEFLKDVFAAAAPRGIPVEVAKVDQAVQEWKLNEFNGEQVLILLKKIDALKRLYEQGLCFDSVQIGGLASGPGRKLVVKAIGLSEQDAVELKSLGKQGVKIYFQSMPGEKEILLDTILGKYFNNIK